MPLPWEKTGSGYRANVRGNSVSVTPSGQQAIATKWEDWVANNAADASKVPAWGALTPAQRGEALRRMGAPVRDVGTTVSAPQEINPATGAPRTDYAGVLNPAAFVPGPGGAMSAVTPGAKTWEPGGITTVGRATVTGSTGRTASMSASDLVAGRRSTWQGGLAGTAPASPSIPAVAQQQPPIAPALTPVTPVEPPRLDAPTAEDIAAQDAPINALLGASQNAEPQDVPASGMIGSALDIRPGMSRPSRDMASGAQSDRYRQRQLDNAAARGKRREGVLMPSIDAGTSYAFDGAMSRPGPPTSEPDWLKLFKRRA